MIHTVLPGETLRGIAAMHGTGPDLLAAWNGTAEPLTGQELLVLHPQALHTVRRGESWQSLSARFGLPELRRCNPGPLRPGRRLVLGFRERGTRTLALCGTMGPEWNDLGLSYTCELAADAAELDGDGALHRLPLRGRPACLRLTGSGAKLETLLRSRAAQERLLLETAALCRAHGTAQVELAVRDLLPDCDPAPLVSRLQALLAERGGGLTLALPRPGALGWLPLPDGCALRPVFRGCRRKNYWRTMTMRRATAAAFGRSGSAGARRWPWPGGPEPACTMTLRST